jgi:alginate O-acetyltransferase complex protein AlgI
MSVCSAEFIVAFLLLAAGFFRLPSDGSRRAALALANVAFLYLSVPNWGSWIALGIFVLSGYGVGRLLLRRPSGALFFGYLAAMVATFVVIKKYDVLTPILPVAVLHHALVVVGLSYILFRQIHFLVDVLQAQIPDFTLGSYLNYQINFLTLLSGPIQRFQEFQAYWLDPRPLATDRHDLLLAFQRIMVGTLKISVLSAVCIYYWEGAKNGIDHAMSGEFPLTRRFALRHFATMFYLYPAYVYFNFSGYCDVVIGAGRLVGLRIPENFDRPYLARNMIDFWTRQHMTLSFWIRDYLFTPMFKSLAERWPRRASAAVFLCYFVSFFLAGVWHGATMNFVVFGLLHGLGVSAAKIWETYLIRRGGRAGYRKYLQRPLTRVVAIVATMHFVALAFLFFTPNLNKTIDEIRAVMRAVF